MAITTETLFRKLYDNLTSYGYSPKPIQAKTGKVVVPEEADIIQFDFNKGQGVNSVTLAIEMKNERFNLVVYYDDDVSEDDKEGWYKLLSQIRRVSQQSGIQGFELKNMDRLSPDLQKRVYNMKKETLGEGYYAMGKQASYSDAVPTTKIILQHTRKIEEGEQRYRNIAKIFVENMNGERFLLPTTKPGIARVYARHISEGGTPYDERGKHITSLVEEYQKMAGFVRATKNKQFNESTQQLVNEGVNHYQSLRETLHKMCGHRGYNNYFENWQPTLVEDGEEQTNLNELFVQETLDPRIESVIPILSRLQKRVSEMKETNELAEWTDSLVSEALDINEENVPIKDKEDYKARLKAIQDILVDPNTAKDPLLKKETMKRKAELEKEAEEKGFTEGTYGVMDEEGFVSDFRRGINKIDRASEKVSRKKLDHNISTDPEEKRKLARDVNRYNKVLNKPKNRLFRPDDLMGAGDIKEGMAEATGDKKFDNILGNIVKDTPLDYVLSHPRTGILFKRGFKSEEEAKAYNQKKKNGFYSVYPYQWWRDEIEPAIPDFYRKKGVVEGSDISGLLAASHLNKSFIITAELAEGGTKKFRVKAQSERVAKEKFMKHHSMAKIVDVKEEGVSEDLDANQKRAGQLGPTEKVGPKGAVGKLVGGESAEPKDEMLEDITDIIKLSGIKKG